MNVHELKLTFLTETAQRLENISDEEYFGEKYKDYVSNSALGLINPDQGGSPFKFLSGFNKDKNSSALDLGSAVHQLLLEPDKHILSEIKKPSGKIGDIIYTTHQLVSDGLDFDEALAQSVVKHDYYKGVLTDARREKIIDTGKDYYDYLLTSREGNKKSICLSDEDTIRVNACLDSIKNHALIVDTLYPGDPNNPVASYNEDVIVMDYEVETPMDDDLRTNLLKGKLKCKIDNWSIDYENKVLTLNDVKTTGSPVNTFGGYVTDHVNFNGEVYQKRKPGSFEKFHYYRQMAMYSFMLKSYIEAAHPLLLDEDWIFNVHMIVVETNSPHTACLFRVTDKWLAVGQFEFEKLVKMLSYHKIYGFDQLMDADINKAIEI